MFLPVFYLVILTLFLYANNAGNYTFVSMPDREVPEKFLIAFSLAGEQRDLVRSIAEAVETELGQATVFLDEWFEYFLAGHDADLKLQKRPTMRALFHSYKKRLCTLLNLFRVRRTQSNALG
jgi:hypothetical protein